VRHGAGDQRLVAGGDQGARSTVGHRQRAAIDIRGRGEQVHQRELVDAGEASVPALVSRGHQALLRREALGEFPQGRDFNQIDAVAPGIPGRMPGFVKPVGELHAVQFAAREFAERRKFRLHRRQHLRRQRALQVRAQYAVVGVLVGEFGWGLVEGHGKAVIGDW
jgi:hypothetical protein